jgi:hypothetical protein
MSDPATRRRRSRWFGWWYVSIGAGFFLLGLHRLLIGGALWTIVLRWIIAAGFVALGYAELRSWSGRKDCRD